MLEIFLIFNFQLKCCWNRYELTYNAGFFPIPMNISLMKYRPSSVNINFGNFDNAIVEQNIEKADI